jgi:anaphase-promoting complex subunit 4
MVDVRFACPLPRRIVCDAEVFTVSAIIRDTVENPLPPRHDVLEVNNYFMSGLVVSSIDKWFMGPVPQFSPRDLGVPASKQNLTEVLKRAKSVMRDPAQMAWSDVGALENEKLESANLVRLDRGLFQIVKHQDLSHLDRNLDALIQELATRCQRVFTQAAGATSRSAVVTFGQESLAKQERGPRPRHERKNESIIRERIVRSANEVNVQ